jgi:hypothetical protein
MSKTKKLLVGAVSLLVISALAWSTVSSDLTDMQGRFSGRLSPHISNSLSHLSPMSPLTPLTPVADLSDGPTHSDDDEEDRKVFNPFNRSGSFSPWNK